jgi:hypothetical protein
MTVGPPHPGATGQPGQAAGIGAVAVAILVAIAVAGLFLIEIGEDRTERLAAPEHYPAPGPLGRPSDPGDPWLFPA